MSRGDKQQRRKANMRERGVRVQPLPAFMHQHFLRLVADLRCHAQSHYGTWKAAIGYSDHSAVHANAIYWRSVIRYLNQLEYLGVNGNEPRGHSGHAGVDDGHPQSDE